MKYQVYQTTNNLNGKIYIGCHKTLDTEDDYLGSGKLLKRAIEKYKAENFTKTVLFEFDNPEEMFAKEKELVDEEFVQRKDTYNLKVGGEGGFDFINSSGRNSAVLLYKGKPQSESGAFGGHQGNRGNAEGMHNYWRDYYAKGGVSSRKDSTWKQTEEALKNQKAALKENKHQQGEKNSQFGTRWIHSLIEKKSKKIKKTDPLPYNWYEGRKIKF